MIWGLTSSMVQPFKYNQSAAHPINGPTIRGQSINGSINQWFKNFGSINQAIDCPTITGQSTNQPIDHVQSNHIHTSLPAAAGSTFFFPTTLMSRFPSTTPCAANDHYHEQSVYTFKSSSIAYQILTTLQHAAVTASSPPSPRTISNHCHQHSRTQYRIG